jgi:RNA polymerase sigma-70 factor (ECF subfamily)
MAEDASFSELVSKVRAGDEEAAATLVRRYEPALRKAIRSRLTDPGMRRILDSMDVCQSVMSNFFVRAAAGQFDLKNPKQLIALLATMARNKVTNLALKERAARRGGGGARVGLSDVQPAARDPSPSQIVAGDELLHMIRDRLTDEERYLAEQRALERSWAEIAAEIGGDPDALRIRLGRAIDRVARQLGLE